MHDQFPAPSCVSRFLWALSVASLLGCLPFAGAAHPPKQGERPNVLFIIIDDHPAHMVSVLNESVVKTPNMERLAERGTWFTRGYNAAPVCAASRVAFLTGVHPSNSGAYNNPNAWKRTDRPIAQAESMHGLFLRNGYLTAGFGKIDHTPWQWDTLDDFTPGYRVGHRNDPKAECYSDAQLAGFAIPETLRIPKPDYLATRFGALPDDWDRDDPKKMQEDTQHANRAISFLQKGHKQPFFLTVGFWRPHSERIVPKRYFDMYPLDEIQLPAGFKEGDLDDVPEPGRFWATRLGIHDAVVDAGLLREYLRSFYAATSYIDEQIGRVLDGIDLAPVLKGETKERGRPVLSTYTRGNHTVRGNRYRYIRYANGDEELYDHDADPHEWKNLANHPDLEPVKKEMRRWLPQRDAPAIGNGASWKGSVK